MKSQLTGFVPRPTRNTAWSEPTRIFAACAVLLLAGCHSTAYKIATYQNNYDFRIARFREDCGKPVKCADLENGSTQACADRCTALTADEKALHEAATALANKGGLPLQMKALAAADKAVK